MQRQPISAEDAELLARITRLVLSEPDTFARGAELLREDFSHTAMRRRALARLCELRRATYEEEQERVMGKWIEEQPAMRWRNSNGRLLFHQPGQQRRFHRQHIRWTRSSGQRTDAVHARFDEALAWARELPRSLITLSEAEAICLLAWMLYDELANERTPVLAEFQLLPWGCFPEGEESFRPARQLAADSVVFADWVQLAAIALAKVEANRDARTTKDETEPSGPALPPDSFLPVDEIARIARVPLDALRKRLERWRAKNEGDWIEGANPRRGEPRYLYRWGGIQEILHELRES